jgi:hypothetical protein
MGILIRGNLDFRSVSWSLWGGGGARKFFQARVATNKSSLHCTSTATIKN